MKSKKRVVTIAVVSLLGLALVAAPAVAKRGAADGRGRGEGVAMVRRGPAFTEEQQEKIQEIHERHADERARLTNRLKVIGVEMRDLVQSDNPDLNALENKIEEASEVRLELTKMRLSIHSEIRPLLDDDQKVLFDRSLGRLIGRMGGGGFDRSGGRMDRPGMRGGAMSGEGRMGPCGAMGGPGGFHGQGMQMCPFVDADTGIGK